MRKNLTMMLSAVMLIAVSCSKSKEEPKDGTPKTTCLMSERIYADNEKDRDVYTYDDKGNPISCVQTRNSGTETKSYAYTYTSSAIVVKEDGTSIATYQLDAQGRIKSYDFNKMYSDPYTTIFTYNADGYLAEERTVYATGNRENVTKYTWTNGNLTKSEYFDNGSSTPSNVTSYQYSADIWPSNFFDEYINLYGDNEVLNKYFGKQPKNLPSVEIYDGGTNAHTYTKDDKGNIIKRATKSSTTWTPPTCTFKYTCK